MNMLGKSLIALGALLALIGALILAAGKFPLIGRLPGDIHVKRGQFEFYFPLATCLLISLILSLILALLRRR